MVTRLESVVQSSLLAQTLRNTPHTSSKSISKKRFSKLIVEELYASAVN